MDGPGESKHADFGSSLPGTGETPTAPVFIDGTKAAKLRSPMLATDFKTMVIDYIERRYGTDGRANGGGVGFRLRQGRPIKKSRMKSHPRCDSVTGPWHGLAAVAAGGKDLT